MDGVILTNGRVRDLDPRWLNYRLLPESEHPADDQYSPLNI